MQHQYVVAVHGSAARRCMVVHVSNLAALLKATAEPACAVLFDKALHTLVMLVDLSYGRLSAVSWHLHNSCSTKKTLVLNIVATVPWLQLCEDQEEKEDENDDGAEEYDAEQDEAAGAEGE